MYTMLCIICLKYLRFVLVFQAPNTFGKLISFILEYFAELKLTWNRSNMNKFYTKVGIALLLFF